LSNKLAIKKRRWSRLRSKKSHPNKETLPNLKLSYHDEMNKRKAIKKLTIWDYGNVENINNEHGNSGASPTAENMKILHRKINELVAEIYILKEEIELLKQT